MVLSTEIFSAADKRPFLRTMELQFTTKGARIAHRLPFCSTRPWNVDFLYLSIGALPPCEVKMLIYCSSSVSSTFKSNYRVPPCAFDQDSWDIRILRNIKAQQTPSSVSTALIACKYKCNTYTHTQTKYTWNFSRSGNFNYFIIIKPR